jgi:signal transduction histidine kinase
MKRLQHILLVLILAIVSSTEFCFANDIAPIAKSKQLVDSLNNLAYNSRRNNPRLSLEFALEAYKVSKEVNYDFGFAFAVHNVGTAKAVLGRFDKALIDLMEAARLRETLEDKEGLTSTYNNIGYVYSELGNDRKALEYYEKAFELYQQTELKRDVGIVLNNIGHVNFRNGNFEEALKYFYRALEINEADKDVRGAGASKANIGSVYRSIGEFKKGLQYHLEAHSVIKEANDILGMVSILKSIAEDYFAMNQLDKATEYALESVRLAQEIGSVGDERTSAGTLALIYEKSGKFKEAAKYFKVESSLKDSLFSIEKAEVLGRLESVYEIEGKSKENEYLRKEQEINTKTIRLQNYLLILSTAIVLIALFLMGYIFSAKNRIKESNILLLQKNNEITLQKETILEKAKALDEKNRELQGINEIKDKLISVIAHDLKNPFNSISGYSELLISRIDSYSKSEAISFLRVIHDNSVKGNMLLDNLLQWSRLRTNTLQFFPNEQNLNKLVLDELFFVQHIANEKEIRILTSIRDDVSVYADSNMLKTVIRNLVSNAIKFTSNKGTITIAARSNSDSIVISVSDTGMGIDQSVKQKLFTGEVGITTANEKGEMGTGLGLMICKDFVNYHKGKIWVESELGEGSTFIVDLPNKKS